MNELLTERSESILRVQFNRPAKKNAMTAAMYTGLADLLNEADQDDNINVVLLHGAGDSFTAALVLGLLRKMDLDEINAPSISRLMYRSVTPSRSAM